MAEQFESACIRNAHHWVHCPAVMNILRYHRLSRTPYMPDRASKEDLVFEARQPVEQSSCSHRKFVGMSALKRIRSEPAERLLRRKCAFGAPVNRPTSG
jgi:hypothetical protein